MFPEFTLDGDGTPREPLTTEEKAQLESLSEKAVNFLRELLPERELNESFMAIIREGTGKEFEVAHNRAWLKHTRPILEAFTTTYPSGVCFAAPFGA